jgi:phosphoglycolate phosphatase
MVHDASAIVFDLDGTLIDSAASILASMAASLAKHDLAPIAPLEPALIGPPLLATLTQITGSNDQALLQQLAQEFKDRYDSEGYRLSRPYAGIDDLLRALRASGHRLYIATNKRLRPTLSIIEHLGWGDLFAAIGSPDMRQPAYPNKSEMLADLLTDAGVAPADALMVGDTDGDARTAAECGLRYLHVTWGYGTPEANRPVHGLCRSPQQLLSHFQHAEVS